MKPKRKCKKRGCKAWPMAGRQHCFFHDPEKAEERTESARKGGEHRQEQRRDIEWAVLPTDTADVKLDSEDDVLNVTRQTINYVLRGQIDPKVANAVSQALGVALKAIDKSEVDNRLKQLEEQFRPLKGMTADQLLKVAMAGNAADDTAAH